MTIKACVSVLCGEKHKASINQSGHRQVTGCYQPAAVMSLVFMAHTVINSSDLRLTLDWIKEEEKNRVGSLLVLSHKLPERRRQTNERLFWWCLICFICAVKMCSLQVLYHLFPKRCDWYDFYGSSTELQTETEIQLQHLKISASMSLEDRLPRMQRGKIIWV